MKKGKHATAGRRSKENCAPLTGSTELRFDSLSQHLSFRKDETGICISDLRDAWRDMYFLTLIEAKQLSKWIEREVP